MPASLVRDQRLDRQGDLCRRGHVAHEEDACLGVTPAQTASTTSSGSSIGTGSFCTTTRDWRCSGTNVHLPSSAPYSWLMVNTSSPGSSGREPAARFNPAVAFA